MISKIIRPLIVEVGSFFLRPSYHPVPSISLREVKKILVITPVGIGDAVMSIPAIRALRHKFPSAIIDVLCSSWSREVLEGAPYINRLIINESIYHIHNPFRLHRLAKQYRGYDCVVVFSYFTLPLFALFTRSRIRVGPSQGKEGFALTNTTFFKPGVHVVDLFLHIVGLLGAKGSSKLELFHYRRKRRQRYLVGICVGGGNNPLSSLGQKRWPLESYRRLCEQLLEQRCSLVFLGDKDDVGLTASIISELPRYSTKRIQNLVGRTTLKEAATILSECTVFVSNDSALMHIAAAVGTKTITFFGPTDPEMLAPRGHGHLALQPRRRCSACLPRRMEFSGLCKRGGHMDSISVRDALVAIKSMGVFRALPKRL